MPEQRIGEQNQLLDQYGEQAGTYVDPNKSKIGKPLAIPSPAASPLQDKPPSPMPGEGPAAYAARLKKWREEQALKKKKVGAMEPNSLQGVVMQQMASANGMDGSLIDAFNGAGIFDPNSALRPGELGGNFDANSAVRPGEMSKPSIFKRPDDTLNQALQALIPFMNAAGGMGQG